MLSLLVCGLVLAQPARAEDAKVVLQVAETDNCGGERNVVFAMDAAQRVVASATGAGRVTLFDLSSRRVLNQFTIPGMPSVEALEVIGDGHRVLVWTYDSISSFDTLSGAPLFSVPRERFSARFAQGQVKAVAVAPGLERWALADSSATVVKRLDGTGTPMVLEGGADALLFEPTGRWLYTAHRWGDLQVRIIDLERGLVAAQWSARSEGADHLSFVHSPIDGAFALELSRIDGKGAVRLFSSDPQAAPIELRPAMSPGFDARGRLYYLDGEGCFHRRDERGVDERLPLACVDQLLARERRFLVVADDLLLMDGLLLSAEDGRVVADLEPRVVCQELLSVDDANGTVKVGLRLSTVPSGIPQRQQQRSRTRRPASGGAWSLATGTLAQGAEEVVPTCAPTPAISDWDPKWPAAHDAHRVVSAAGSALHLCGADGRFQRTLRRPATASALRFVALLDAERALLVDDHGDEELWNLARGKLLKRQPAPAWRATKDSFGRTPLAAFAGPASGSYVVVSHDRVELVAATGQRTQWFDGSVWSAAASPGASRLALASPGRVMLLEPGSAQPPRSLSLDGRSARRLLFGATGKRLYLQLDDGTLALADFETATVTARLLAVGDDGSAIALPDGRYLASRGALNAFGARRDLHALPRSEFDPAVNRPDEVLATLGVATPAALEAVRDRVARRRQRQGAAAQPAGFALQPDNPPPLEVSARTLRLDFALPQAMKGTLRVFVNNVPDAAASRPFDGSGARAEVDLLNGTNSLLVFAELPDGRRSEPWLAVVEARLPSRPSRVRFLGIGVSQYRQPNWSLRFAAKDVGDAERLFSSLWGSAFDSRLLLDQAATRANIEAAAGFLADTAVDDTVIIYVAGHGLLGDAYGYRFAPYDMQFEDPARTGLPFSLFERLLAAAPARRRLVFIDSCHAGEAFEGTASPRSRPAPLGGQVTTRGLEDEPDAMKVDGSSDVEDTFSDLRLNTGANVIAAAGPTEYAFESEQLSNGVFTRAVLEALGSRATDVDEDKVITVDELRTRVRREVGALTGGRQVPRSRQENLEFDFALLRGAEPFIVPVPATGSPGQFLARRAGDGVHDVLVGRQRAVLLDAHQAVLAEVRLDAPCAASAMEELAVSFDGRRAVARCHQPGHDAHTTLMLVDFLSGQSTRLLEVVDGPTFAPVALSANGQFAGVVDGRALLLWRLDDAQLTASRVELRDGVPTAFVLKPAGDFVAMVSGLQAPSVVRGTLAGVTGSSVLPLPANTAWEYGQVATLDEHASVGAAVTRAGDQRLVLTWDLAHHALRSTLPSLGGVVSLLPDGDVLVQAYPRGDGAWFRDSLTGLPRGWLGGAGLRDCVGINHPTLDVSAAGDAQCPLGIERDVLKRWRSPLVR